MKSFSRRCLGVLLSILMIVGCLSAAFIPAQAAGELGALQTALLTNPALQTALDELEAAFIAADTAGALTVALTNTTVPGNLNNGAASRSTNSTTTCGTTTYNGGTTVGNNTGNNGPNNTDVTQTWVFADNASTQGYIGEIAVAFTKVMQAGMIQAATNTEGPDGGSKFGFTWWTFVYWGLKDYFGVTATNRASWDYMLGALTNMKQNNNTTVLTLKNASFTKDWAGNAWDLGNNTARNTTDYGSDTSALPLPMDTYQARGVHTSIRFNVSATEMQQTRRLRSIAEVRRIYNEGGFVQNVQYTQNGAAARADTVTPTWASYNYFSGGFAVPLLTRFNPTLDGSPLRRLIEFDNYFFATHFVGMATQTDPFAPGVTLPWIDALVNDNNYWWNRVTGTGLTEADIRNIYSGTTKVDEVIDFMQACRDAQALIRIRLNVEYFMARPGGFDTRILDNGEHLTMTRAQLQAWWEEQQPHYLAIMGVSPAVRTLAAFRYGLDMVEIEAARAALLHRLQIRELLDLKVEIDGYYEPYKAYMDAYTGPIPAGPSDEPAWTDYQNYEKEWFNAIQGDDVLQALSDRFGIYCTRLTPPNPYTQAQIDEVFNDPNPPYVYSTYVFDYRAKLFAEAQWRGLHNDVKDHYRFFNDIAYSPTLGSKSTDELIGLLKNPWVAGNRGDSGALAGKVDFYNKMDNAYNTKVAAGTMSLQGFNIVYTDFLPTIDLAIERLYQVLAARFAYSTEGLMDLYDGEAESVGYENVAQLRKAFGTAFDDAQKIWDAVPELQAYLNVGLIADYNAFMGRIGNEYKWFIENGAFDKYEQIKPGDPFKDPDYPVRFPYDATKPSEDVARHGDPEKYEVTDFLMDETFRKLEGLLTGPAFAQLACMDIGSCINSLPQMLYSDSIINSIVDALFPMVVDMVEDVLIGFPTVTTNAQYRSMWCNCLVVCIDNVFTCCPGINCYVSSIAPTNISLKSLREITTEGEFNGQLNLYPDQVANVARAWGFTDAANELAKMRARTTAQWRTYPTRAWDDDTFDVKKLDWGIDKQTTAAGKENQFKNALAAVLASLWPLLKAALLDQNMSMRSGTLTFANVTADARGLPVVGNASVTVSNLQVVLASPGSPGYARFLTPLFEGVLGVGFDPASLGTLGSPNVPTITEMSDASFGARALVDAIFDPIFGDFIGDLAGAPLSAIVELLPNLSYSLIMDRLFPAMMGYELMLWITVHANARAALIVTCTVPGNCFGCFFPIDYNLKMTDIIGGGCRECLHAFMGDPQGLMGCLMGGLMGSGGGGCLGCMMGMLSCGDCGGGDSGGGDCGPMDPLPCMNLGRMVQYGDMTQQASKRAPSPVDWNFYYETYEEPKMVAVYEDVLRYFDILDSNGKPIPMYDSEGRPIIATTTQDPALAAKDENGNPIVYESGANLALAAPGPILLTDADGNPVQDVNILSGTDESQSPTWDGTPGSGTPLLDEEGEQVYDGDDPVWYYGEEVIPYYVYSFECTYVYEQEARWVSEYQGQVQDGMMSMFRPRSTPVTGTNNELWYHIDPDKGDQLLFLLRYLFPALENPAIQGLLEGLMGSGGTMAMVMEILGGAGKNPEDSIAAIVELFNPKPSNFYKMREMRWVYTNGTNPKVQYSDIWTREDAQFATDNFIPFIDAIIKLLGVYDSKGNLYSFNGLIKELLGGLVGNMLYSPSLINSLIGMLGGLDLGDFDVIIKDILGVDLGALGNFPEVDFEPGDREAFVEALCGFLRPIYPLLGFLLNSQDIELFGAPVLAKDSSGNPVQLRDAEGNLVFQADGTTPVYEYTLGDPAIVARGYDGYAGGVIPLLEGLSVNRSSILTPAQYKAAIERDPDAILTAILNPVLDWLEDIIAGEAGSWVPNLLYFVKSGGLDVAINNILHAIWVLLDTIRPLYPLDIGILIDLIGGGGGNDIIDMVMGLLNDMSLESILGLVMPLLEDLLGFSFDLPLDILDSLMVGTITRYTSKNGKTAYRLDGGGGDLTTALLRFAIEFVFHSENLNMVIDLLGGLVDFDLEFLKQLTAIVDSLYPLFNRVNGTDRVLKALLNLCKAAGCFVTGTQNLIDHRHKDWVSIITAMKNSGLSGLEEFAAALEKRLVDNFGGHFQPEPDPPEVPAPRGMIPFFSAFLAWLQKIFALLLSPFTMIFGLFG